LIPFDTKREFSEAIDAKPPSAVRRAEDAGHALAGGPRDIPDGRRASKFDILPAPNSR
jgi:hypothetical protein